MVEALEMLRRMTHRGACGCETNTGAGRASGWWARGRASCYVGGAGCFLFACWIGGPVEQAVPLAASTNLWPTAPAALPKPLRSWHWKTPPPLLHAPCAGDGAGILVGIPHLFLSEVAEKECGIELPPQVRRRRG